MKRQLFMLSGLLTILMIASGCAVTVAQAVYKSVTYDDVVYVREDRMLYKRFRRDGLLAPESLRGRNLGSITQLNDQVIIFSNFGEAVASGLRFYIDPVSRPDLAYSTHPRSTTVRDASDYHYSRRQQAKIDEELALQKTQDTVAEPDASVSAAVNEKPAAAPAVNEEPVVTEGSAATTTKTEAALAAGDTGTTGTTGTSAPATVTKTAEVSKKEPPLQQKIHGPATSGENKATNIKK